MAELGNLEIANRSATHQAGAAILLNDEPFDDYSIQVNREWTVEMESDNPYSIARCETNLDPDDVLRKSHETIQQALDMLCINDEETLFCQDMDLHRIIWWRDAGQQHLRTVNIAEQGFRSNVTVTVVDSSGEDRGPNPSRYTEWHEGQRYFRLSQASEDLFTAYRNMYLAFESVLSDLVTPRNSEGERDWLLRALRDAHSRVDLSAYAPDKTDVIRSIDRQQRDEVRNQMFHAKQNRSRLLPHEFSDQAQVRNALENLSGIVLKLMKELVTINRTSGMMTPTGFKMLSSWMRGAGDLTGIASNDSIDDIEVGEIDIKQSEGDLVVSAAYSEELSKPGLESVLAQIEHSGENTEISGIRLTVDGEPTILGRFAQPLRVTDVDHLEMHLGLVLRNRQLPRTRFPS